MKRPPLDGVALPGILFAPTSGCLKRLANHHLTFRKREACSEVYYQTNPEAGSPLMGKIEDNVSFDFIIQSKGGDFSKRHLSAITTEKGPHLYFDNLDAQGNIQSVQFTQMTIDAHATEKDTARFHDPIFYESIDPQGQSASVLVKNRFDGSLLKSFEVQPVSGGGRALVQIDLSDLSSGLYSLSHSGSASSERNIYVDKEVARVKPLGLIQIHLDRPQNEISEEGVEFNIYFQV